MLTFLRKSQYQDLSEITLNGKILDLGGSVKASYHPLIKGEHEFTVVNLDERYGYDLKFDLEENFPLENSSYDAIICLNLLEHLFNFQNAVNESYRVLKESGIIVGSTPFMYNIHGSPDDFFRYTKSGLRRILEKAGFGNIEIKELGSGMFGAVYQTKFNIYNKLGPFNEVALMYHVFLDKILKKIFSKKHFSEEYFPLGYFFTARK